MLLKLIDYGVIKLAACQEEFGTIMKHFSTTCTLQCVTVQELLRCVTEVPKKPHYQEYILKSSSNLTQCTTVDDFVSTLCSVYSDFIFYHLFEKVVVAFGNEILRNEMERYKEKLISIMTVAKVAECIPKATIITNSAAEIVLEIQIPYVDCTIGDIELVRDEIRNISYIFEFCCTMYKASGDSTTIIKWFFPQAYSRHLQVDLLLSFIPFKNSFLKKQNISASALMVCGVVKMCVDGLCVFEYDTQDKAVSEAF